MIGKSKMFGHVSADDYRQMKGLSPTQKKEKHSEIQRQREMNSGWGAGGAGIYFSPSRMMYYST